MAGTKRKEPAAEAAVPTATAQPTMITPTVITNEILENRLLTGLGIQGGSQGSLTRCAIRLAEFRRRRRHHQQQQQQPLDDTTSTTNEAAADALIRQVQHAQAELTKLLVQTTFMLPRNIIHTTTTTTTIPQLQALVRDKRLELAQQLRVTACEREYETLAHLALTKHVTSRKVLLQELDKVSRECQETTIAIQQKQAETAVRQAQFQLLMQCILDLKHSLAEQPIQSDDNMMGVVPIQVDDTQGGHNGSETEAEEGQEEDDGALLYDDL
jgi:hypothetical protein